MLYTMLTFFIFGQSYTYFIIAMQYQALYHSKAWFIHKIFDLNSFSYCMPRGLQYI